MKNAPCAEKAEARKLVESIQPSLRQAVQAACRKYLSQTDKTLIEDFCQEITFRLIESDCHRLQSFAYQSLLKT